MPISFDSALGIHTQALSLRSRSAEMLASNIANADTPGFKARDIDFKSVLEAAGSQNTSLRTTHANHISTNSSVKNAEALYRVPNQASLDGNTVDSQLEKGAFAENALRYQASLSFVDGKLKGIMSALRGE